MKKRISSVVPFLLTMFVLYNTAHAQMPPPLPPSITVTGEASEDFTPDQVTLYVGVQVENKQLAAAKEEADKKLRKALDVIKEFGVKKEKLKTTNSSVSPQYDYQKDTSKPIFRAYRATTMLNITLSEPEKASILMEKLINAGIDQVGAAQFGLADPKKARDSLLEAALKDARAKAERMASAMDMTLGKPLHISETGGTPYRAYMVDSVMGMASAPAMMKADMAAPELPSGVIEMQQQVSVEFTLQ